MVKAEEKVHETTEKDGEFTIKMDNPRILKGIIETLSSIIDEAMIKIDKSEFSIKAMDPSRICLLQLSIKKVDFDEYKCSSKACQVGLNLDDLDKILRRSNANDIIELSYKEVEQKIIIKMQREGNSRSRTFSLAILDIESEEVPMENLLKIDYSCKWKIEPEIVVEAIKDAEIYNEIFNFKASENGVNFSSRGQIGEMNYELDVEDLVDHECSEETTGAYSMVFLKSILKIASITDQLEISLRTDHPLKMIFNLLEGGELSYFLAPRVEEEGYDDEEEF